MELNVRIRVLYSFQDGGHSLIHPYGNRPDTHDYITSRNSHMTYEVGPMESRILLHSLMIKSQLASPRPLVAFTMRKKHKKN